MRDGPAANLAADRAAINLADLEQADPTTTGAARPVRPDLAVPQASSTPLDQPLGSVLVPGEQLQQVLACPGVDRSTWWHAGISCAARPIVMSLVADRLHTRGLGDRLLVTWPWRWRSGGFMSPTTTISPATQPPIAPRRRRSLRVALGDRQRNDGRRDVLRLGRAGADGDGCRRSRRPSPARRQEPLPGRPVRAATGHRTPRQPPHNAAPGQPGR